MNLKQLLILVISVTALCFIMFYAGSCNGSKSVKQAAVEQKLDTSVTNDKSRLDLALAVLAVKDAQVKRLISDSTQQSKKLLSAEKQHSAAILANDKRIDGLTNAGKVKTIDSLIVHDTTQSIKDIEDSNAKDSLISECNREQNLLIHTIINDSILLADCEHIQEEQANSIADLTASNEHYKEKSKPHPVLKCLKRVGAGIVGAFAIVGGYEVYSLVKH